MENIPYTWIRKLNIVKWQYFPNWCGSPVCSIKIQADFFAEMDKLIVKFMELQVTYSEKQEQSWRTHTSQFQDFFKKYGNQHSVILA